MSKENSSLVTLDLNFSVKTLNGEALLMKGKEMNMAEVFADQGSQASTENPQKMVQIWSDLYKDKKVTRDKADFLKIKELIKSKKIQLADFVSSVVLDELDKILK